MRPGTVTRSLARAAHLVRRAGSSVQLLRPALAQGASSSDLARRLSSAEATIDALNERFEPSDVASAPTEEMGGRLVLSAPNKSTWDGQFTTDTGWFIDDCDYPPWGVWLEVFGSVRSHDAWFLLSWIPSTWVAGCAELEHESAVDVFRWLRLDGRIDDPDYPEWREFELPEATRAELGPWLG